MKQRVWVCTVCGHEHTGPVAPDVCPVCGVGADMFQPEEEEASSASSGASGPGDDTDPADAGSAASDSSEQVWVCTVCGYEHVGEAPPDECPVCGVAADMFQPKGHAAPSASDVATTARDAAAQPAPSRGVSVLGDPPTVSDVMIATMIEWGVTHVFGMVGHSNLGLSDAIRRQEEAGKLKFIGIRHEGAASFAASAFAKLTGKPSACLSIAGPGATNLLTGLWDAKVDRAPVLALTGQIETQVLGPGAFQEVDLSAAFDSVATWSQTVLSESRHAELMTLALKHAVLERNVSHLVFPDEVQTLRAPILEASSPVGRIAELDVTPSETSVTEAVELLTKAKRPAIIVGHGARGRMDQILEFAQKLRCPVITTFKGKGLVADQHPLACGVLGRSGTQVAGHFQNNADLLVVLGASFAKHTGIKSTVPTIQVDFDPLALGKFHPVTVPVYGEIGRAVDSFMATLGDVAAVDQTVEIAEQWQKWRKEKARRRDVAPKRGLASATVFDSLSRLVPQEAVIAVDVGNNTYSFGRYFESQGQPVLMSGYLGSIGFGYPAAMGAWAAAPGRPIVAITGDGGFAQYLAELTTAVKYGMNITHVLINNDELGKISLEQRTAKMPVWKTDLKNPSFAEYAKLCGASGERVESADNLEAAIKRAFDVRGPSLVEIITDPELV